MNLLKYASLYVSGILLAAVPVFASVPSSAPSSALSSGGSTVVSDESAGSQKPLQVNGQSRNLNMMLVLRNDKDKIKFVHPRENYRDEIAQENVVQKIVSDSATTPNPMKEGKN